MIESLQGTRAIAAILVLLFHASGSFFANPKYWGVRPFGCVFDFGHAGVDFFFVLSGFIIAHAHFRDIGVPGRWRSYLGKRWRRIYPPYWAVTAALIPVYFLKPSLGLGHERHPGAIACSLLLLPWPDGPILGVAWSLCHEVLFYVLFLGFLYDRRVGAAIFVTWAVYAIWPTAGRSWPQSFLGSLHNLQFMMGMLASAIFRRCSVPWPRTLAASGGAVFLAAGVAETAVQGLDARWLLLAYGAGAMVTVLGLAEAERRELIRVPRVLVYLGAASYSIYLVHVPALSVLAKVSVAAALPARLPAQVAFVLIVGAALCCGVAFYLVVERPLLRLLAGAPRATPEAPRG